MLSCPPTNSNSEPRVTRESSLDNSRRFRLWPSPLPSRVLGSGIQQPFHTLCWLVVVHMCFGASSLPRWRAASSVRFWIARTERVFFSGCELTISIAAGLAELSSAYPSTGGQYHFAFMVSSPSTRASVAFVMGWLSVIAYCLFTASATIVCAQITAAIAGFWHEDFVAT
jgi:hypothetical protein